MRGRHDLAKEAVRRAQQGWGMTAWTRFSEHERAEKAARELLSMLAAWTLPSLTPEQREVGTIARDLLGLLYAEPKGDASAAG